MVVVEWLPELAQDQERGPGLLSYNVKTFFKRTFRSKTCSVKAFFVPLQEPHQAGIDSWSLSCNELRGFLRLGLYYDNSNNPSLTSLKGQLPSALFVGACSLYFHNSLYFATSLQCLTLTPE